MSGHDEDSEELFGPRACTSEAKVESVTIDNYLDKRGTIIRINRLMTNDKPGQLASCTAILQKHGPRQTEGYVRKSMGRFVVTDSMGRKVEDAALLEQLTSELAVSFSLEHSGSITDHASGSSRPAAAAEMPNSNAIAFPNEKLEQADNDDWWGGITAEDTVDKIMKSPVQVVHQDADLASTKLLMSQHKIPSLLVDTGSDLPGFITLRDFLKVPFKNLKKIQVREIMTHPVIHVDVHTTVAECSRVLNQAGVQRVAVCDPSRATPGNPIAAFIGFVSDTDIFSNLNDARSWGNSPAAAEGYGLAHQPSRSGSLVDANNWGSQANLAAAQAPGQGQEPNGASITPQAPAAAPSHTDSPATQSNTPSDTSPTSSRSHNLTVDVQHADVDTALGGAGTAQHMHSTTDSMSSSRGTAHSSSLQHHHGEPSPQHSEGSSPYARMRCAAALWELDFQELELIRRIGEGSFGEVLLGNYRGTKVAIKRLRAFETPDVQPSGTARRADPVFQQFFEREIEILASIRHPNVVNFIGACHEPPNVCLVTEYCARGSLDYLLHKSGIALDLAKKVEFAMDIARGLSALHAQRPIIVHRDLKTANLLVSARLEVKVADFGLSRIKDHTTMVNSKAGLEGTVEYCAPEVLRGEPYSEKCDVWSFGVVVWELIHRQRPYADADVPTFLLMMSLGNGTLRLPPIKPEDATPVIAAMAERCMAWQPCDRPSFREILQTLESEYKTVRSRAAVPRSDSASSVRTQDSSAQHLVHSTSDVKSNEAAVQLRTPSGTAAAPVAAVRHGWLEDADGEHQVERQPTPPPPEQQAAAAAAAFLAQPLQEPRRTPQAQRDVLQQHSQRSTRRWVAPHKGLSRSKSLPTPSQNLFMDDVAEDDREPEQQQQRRVTGPAQQPAAAHAGSSPQPVDEGPSGAASDAQGMSQANLGSARQELSGELPRLRSDQAAHAGQGGGEGPLLASVSDGGARLLAVMRAMKDQEQQQWGLGAAAEKSQGPGVAAVALPTPASQASPFSPFSSFADRSWSKALPETPAAPEPSPFSPFSSFADRSWSKALPETPAAPEPTPYSPFSSFADRSWSKALTDSIQPAPESAVQDDPTAGDSVASPFATSTNKTWSSATSADCQGTTGSALDSKPPAPSSPFAAPAADAWNNSAADATIPSPASAIPATGTWQGSTTHAHTSSAAAAAPVNAGSSSSPFAAQAERSWSRGFDADPASSSPDQSSSLLLPVLQANSRSAGYQEPGSSSSGGPPSAPPPAGPSWMQPRAPFLTTFTEESELSSSACMSKAQSDMSELDTETASPAGTSSAHVSSNALTIDRGTSCESTGADWVQRCGCAGSPESALSATRCCGSGTVIATVTLHDANDVAVKPPVGAAVVAADAASPMDAPDTSGGQMVAAASIQSEWVHV